MDVNVQLQAPAALTSGKETRAPSEYEVRESRSGDGGEEKISPPLPGIEPRSPRPCPSHYTNLATAALFLILHSQNVTTFMFIYLKASPV
jgi:hypothetical protein